jgi:hypothetical protein
LAVLYQRAVRPAIAAWRDGTATDRDVRLLDALLDKATDDELQQWGGLPTTEAGWKEVLKQVADASKQ